jgi:hypothetical protein
MRTVDVITLRSVLLAAVLVFSFQALPQSLAAQSVSHAPSLQTTRIPAGTIVELEFVEILSSKTSKMGQTFSLRLREPIVIDGQTVVPAGAMGGGEVIDASRAGIGGRSGKLIVSGRFLDFQGQRARIRGLQSVLAGKDRSRTAVNTAILVPYVGFLGTFVQGGEIEIPVGTGATAQLAADFVVSTSAQSIPTETPILVDPSSTTPKR